ncbi:PREDICTED: uncharacterized protein LOC108773396 isoform X1 [Cyphomyrmex costatus]|uniref:uncharacterized protein LOC108773396 isoform X1 n=2 Tax=Cyphomyrmex costatus TaxID=456900 RepID=UPI00085226BB|nr:PREDICTED: uncharacterized protein LOC108773396 isoform X1 [Cyphomyrmex costatus]
MSLKESKCFSKHREFDAAAKCDLEMFPPDFKKLENICISDAASFKPGTSMKSKSPDILAFRNRSISSLHKSCTVEDNANVKKTISDQNEKDFQRGKINDVIITNNFFRSLTDDNNLSIKTQNQIVNEQYIILSDERTAAKYKQTEKIKNGVTVLPAKPTRSLPTNLKVSIEDNNKKSKLVEVKNKLTNSTQLCADETNMEDNEQNQSFAVQNIKKKMGRPRKVINDSIDQITPTNSKDKYDILQEIPETESITRDRRCANKIRTVSSMSDETSTEEEIFVKKRGRPLGSRGRNKKRGRGRPRGSVKNNKQSQSFAVQNIKKKRGRPRKVINDSIDQITPLQNLVDTEYTTGLTTHVSRSRTESSETDDTNATSCTVNTKNDVIDLNVPHIEKAIQMVTCAKCDQEISKKQWSSHNLNYHNNMAWRKDDEPLDFENDIKLLKKVLTAALKQKKKFFTCEKCEAVKRSVGGFISHMQFCGKSEEERQALMITCPICNAIMMPSSMEVHERYHRQLEQNKIKEADVRIERTKRKAAEKAVPRILEFTKSLKEQNSSTNDVVQITDKKKIPSIWKVMWKKELESGVISCKHIGCTFTCSSYETICEHYYQCDFIPQENFMCKICKFSADSRDKIIDHITEIHSGNNDLEKYSDYETEEDEYLSDESILECDVKRKFNSHHLSKIKSDNTKIYRKMVFLDKEITQNPHSNELFKSALLWTLDFEQKNYELALFKDDMPNCFTLLKNNDAARYFPELTVSMAFKCVNVNSSKTSSDNDSWKRMNRFEGDIYETVPTFFVGGPVWALAWLPIPLPMWSKNPTQYVAISTHPTMESKYTVGKKYLGPNVLQIWDIGSLNHQINSKNRSPVLAYAIAHNSGTIWCLEWCPSGCYQDVDLDNYKADERKIKRMGLLAAACSDGCINIYSLPFADELKFEKTENNSWPIYKTDPVMTLVVNTFMYDNNEQNWQCTKLSWTKEHGHSIIAAGFSNGYIALWHLTTVSPLLLNLRMNTKFINAYHHFFAHYNAITMVALVPYGNSRFLASASVDKSYKFWDLEDTSAPQSYVKKGIVSNGVWMTNWPCAVLSFDDALGYHYTHTMTVPLREYGYKFCPILATNSPTYSLAVSDHANSIAHGTSAGEVMTIFPHQLLYSEKILPKKRQLNSFIEAMDFLEEQQLGNNENNESEDKKRYSKEYHYMPETYNECKDRFGIVFHDNLMDLEKYIASSKPNKDTLNNDKLMSIPIEQYPFTSANRMAWNPNDWSYLWLATSYQNGLVRLLNLNFMNKFRDLNTLLQTRVKSMLDKKEQTNDDK